MIFLNHILFLNSVRTWLLFLGVVLFCLVFLKAFQKVVLHRISLFAEKTETRLDDLVVAVLKNTRFFAGLVLSISIGMKTLATTPTVDRYERLILILVFLYQAAIWTSTAITFALDEAILRRKDQDAGSVTTLKALGLVAKLFLWTVFGLLVLANLGVNITGLVAGLGVGGIAVALAVQNILGDLFASLSIVLDKPFAIGDFITVGDMAGTVEHIGLKTTRVRSLSGEQIIFSNADLLKSRIRNHKRMEERRVVFALNVTFQTAHASLATLAALIREVIEAQPKVRFDRAHFKEIAGSAYVFEMVYFITEPDYLVYMDTHQAINLELVRRLEQEGIELAYPTQTLIHRSSKLPKPISATE